MFITELNHIPKTVKHIKGFALSVGADYSDRHVRKILRGFKMHYAKPYPRNVYYIIGFLDRAAPQTTDNSLTFLSFEKPVVQNNTIETEMSTIFYPFLVIYLCYKYNKPLS